MALRVCRRASLACPRCTHASGAYTLLVAQTVLVFATRHACEPIPIDPDIFAYIQFGWLAGAGDQHSGPVAARRRAELR